MEQLRITDTPLGPITYALARKRVKNWNLRVREGRVYLSVPLNTEEGRADDFICSRAEWIHRAVERQNNLSSLPVCEPLPRAECMRRLTGALNG